MGGQDRAGGKAKPLKAAKSKPKEELDDEDRAYKEQQAANAKALKELKNNVKNQKGPLKTGKQGIGSK